MFIQSFAKIEIERSFLITRGSLFHIQAADILKEIFVIFSQQVPLQASLDNASNIQLFSLIVASINRKAT